MDLGSEQGPGATSFPVSGTAPGEWPRAPGLGALRSVTRLLRSQQLLGRRGGSSQGGPCGHGLVALSVGPGTRGAAEALVGHAWRQLRDGGQGEGTLPFPGAGPGHLKNFTTASLRHNTYTIDCRHLSVSLTHVYTHETTVTIKINISITHPSRPPPQPQAITVCFVFCFVFLFNNNDFLCNVSIMLKQQKPLAAAGLLEL